jgi:hypothetical protein
MKSRAPKALFQKTHSSHPVFGKSTSTTTKLPVTNTEPRMITNPEAASSAREALNLLSIR